MYNGAQYLTGALDSLLAQSFADFELIISDNGSSDGTEEICREFASNDARIRYVRQRKNRGPLANFQFVLDEAVGDYFMWAAHDDRWEPKFLELAVAALDNDEGVGLAFCDMKVTDLVGGESKFNKVQFLRSGGKFVRYLFRLKNECPSLVYGLHRSRELRNIKLAGFDYLDIHITHHYELNSGICAIPLCLYSAGTTGERIPYSITGSFINAQGLFEREWLLLRSHFGLVASMILYAAMRYVYSKNTRVLNTRIRESSKRKTGEGVLA